LGTREVIGRIEVNGYQPNLREVSSRDAGLEKTTEYDQLIEFFFAKTLRRLEKYVVEGIDWDSETNPKSEEEIKRDSLNLIRKLVGQVKDPEKQVKFNDNLLEMVKEKQVEKLPELTKNLEYLKEYVRDTKEKKYFDTQLKAFKVATRTFTKSKNEEIKTKVKEVKTLKGEVKQKEKEILFLTSITGEDEKELIGLQHQVGISTSTINNYLMHLKDGIEKGKTISNEDLLKVIDKISLESHKIIAISNFVTKANFNLMTEKIEKDLVSFIKQYVENVYAPHKKVAVANDNLNIKVNLESDFEFTYNFKPLEIIIILDNLLNNSTKARATNVEITIGQFNENGMWIKVKDDGIGISKEHFDDLFDFGYTTTGGSGIGLHHVRQILKKINGSITANTSLDNGAEFTIKVER
jgi:signal transduction histidine kinase